MPVAVYVALPYLVAESSGPVNKQKPALSATGKHKAIVLAKGSGWNVEIQDQSGKTLHDEQTDFVPYLSVYWIWGPNEQLWLFNSDDGCVHCWYPKSGGGWQHVLWGYGHTKKTELDLGSPPENLYPDYIRQPGNAKEKSDKRKLE